MNKTGEFKLSRLHLMLIVILLFIAVMFLMLFGKDDGSMPSANTQSGSESISLEQVQESNLPNNISTEYDQFDKSTFPRVNTSSIITSSSFIDRSAKDSSSTNSFSILDDESLLNISDILENSLVPTFLNTSESVNKSLDKNAAIDVFVSRLPEGLTNDDFQKVNALLRDYLPYDLADIIAQQTQEKYRLNEQEQAYLSSVLANEASPKTMEEQIVIAKHLESLKGNALPQDSEENLEPSPAYSDWQKTEEKLGKIASSSSNAEQDIRQVIAEQYNSQVADDYIELSSIEKQWQEKYAVFLEEKNIITASGLSEADKAEQIESLIQQHYDESEWAAARGYDSLTSRKVNQDNQD